MTHGYSAWVWLDRRDRRKVGELGVAFPCADYAEASRKHAAFVAKGPPRAFPFGRWVEVFRFRP